MDAQSREKFWNTLCSLDGVDVKQDAQKLADVIQYPKYLYRFRPVSFSSLDGLQSNKLFFQVQITMMTHSIHFYILTSRRLKTK